MHHKLFTPIFVLSKQLSDDLKTKKMKNNINEAMKITVRTSETTVEVLFKDAQDLEQALIESGFTKTENYTYVRPNNFKYQQVMKILQPINHKAQEENQKAQSKEIEKIRNEIKQLLK